MSGLFVRSFSQESEVVTSKAAFMRLLSAAFDLCQTLWIRSPYSRVLPISEMLGCKLPLKHCCCLEMWIRRWLSSLVMWCWAAQGSASWATFSTFWVFLAVASLLPSVKCSGKRCKLQRSLVRAHFAEQESNLRLLAVLPARSQILVQPQATP